MKRNLSIAFALLALASAGWFSASKRVPLSREEGPVAVSPIVSQARPSTVVDAGHDRVSTRTASGTIQGPDLRAETAGRPAVSNPPSSTTRTPEAQVMSSAPVKIPPLTRPHRAISAVSPTRPTPVSNERTRSKHSSATVHRNRVPQGTSAPQPSPPPISSVPSERVKPPNPEIVKPSEIPVEDIASANPAGVPASDMATENEVGTALTAPQPAVWVDLGVPSSLSQDQQGEIQALAESLSLRIAESGFDPASPEYKQVWDEAVVDSDQQFRQRYGNQAWMEHHVQAHHLGNSTLKQDP